jgi:hypothetical protein
MTGNITGLTTRMRNVKHFYSYALYWKKSYSCAYWNPWKMFLNFHKWMTSWLVFYKFYGNSYKRQEGLRNTASTSSAKILKIQHVHMFNGWSVKPELLQLLLQIGSPVLFIWNLLHWEIQINQVNIRGLLKTLKD